jgi:protein SCO1/2
MTRRFWIPVGVAVALMVVLAIAVTKWADAHKGGVLPDYGTLPAFTLENSDGRPVTENDLRGKVNLVDLFYTDCAVGCAEKTVRLRELYDLYAESPRIDFVSITVDPEHDTVEKLRRYADSIGVTDTRWQFLRGSVDEIKSLAEAGLKLPIDRPLLPSGKIVLVDTQNRIRGYYSSEDPYGIRLLKEDIRRLGREMR